MCHLCGRRLGSSDRTDAFGLTDLVAAWPGNGASKARWSLDALARTPR